MPHNGHGGPRPGSGRRPLAKDHAIVLRDTQPWQIPRLDAGELSPLDVMKSNMLFFHHRAAELMAAIMALPLGENAQADQLAALKDLAGMIKCRELAQQCARDLARYTHAPMAAKPASEAANASKHAHSSASPRQRLYQTPSPALLPGCRRSHASGCSAVGVCVGRKRRSAQPQQQPGAVGG